MELNVLQIWERSHFAKILAEVRAAGIELTLENVPEIIKETSFAVRSKKHPLECPYYSMGVSCHPEVKDLNCFLCACPEYNSGSLKGGCNLNSGKGKWFYHKNLPKERVWDCSDCNHAHSSKFVEKYLKENLERLRSLSSAL